MCRTPHLLCFDGVGRGGVNPKGKKPVVLVRMEERAHTAFQEG